MIVVQAIMTDCVIAADGYSYEKAAISNWLQDSNISPTTGRTLERKRLLPNTLLKSAIRAHCGLVVRS